MQRVKFEQSVMYEQMRKRRCLVIDVIKVNKSRYLSFLEAIVAVTAHANYQTLKMTLRFIFTFSLN